MIEEEKKAITREKHPGRVTQGHKLAALMKKRKEEILRNKKQSAEQSTEQPTVESTVQPTVQAAVQPTVQSNYVSGAGILAVLAIGVCVFSRATRSQDKSSMNNLLSQKDVICFKSDDIINK